MELNKIYNIIYIYIYTQIFYITKLNLYLRKVEKEEQYKSRASGRKQIKNWIRS